MKSCSRRSIVKVIAASGALAALPRIGAQPAAPNATSVPASSPPDGLPRQVLRPLSNLSPKNSEGSAIVLRDGSILLLWTEFLDVDLLPEKDRPPVSSWRHSLRTEPSNDDGYARICGMIS